MIGKRHLASMQRSSHDHAGGRIATALFPAQVSGSSQILGPDRPQSASLWGLWGLRPTWARACRKPARKGSTPQQVGSVQGDDKACCALSAEEHCCAYSRFFRVGGRWRIETLGQGLLQLMAMPREEPFRARMNVPNQEW